MPSYVLSPAKQVVPEGRLPGTRQFNLIAPGGPRNFMVNTTVWMHHMDVYKLLGEKARWELHKNSTCYFEQIPQATPHKIATIWPFTAHLTNHPSKMNKTCRTLLEKKEQPHK